MSMADVSRKMERNEAYYYQWVQDGKPISLGEDDRERLGQILGIDPQLLKSQPRADRRSVKRQAADDRLPSFSIRRGTRDLPLILAGTMWTPMPAKHEALTDRPASLLGNARSFAIRLRDDRLAPVVEAGDELYFDPLAVARLEDVVAVIRDGKILVGMLKALDHGKSIELVDMQGARLAQTPDDGQTEILRMVGLTKA